LFSGGVLGLFLLSLVSQRAGPAAAAAAVICGVCAMVWMALPTLASTLDFTLPALLRNPLHTKMTLVVGTLTIFVVGLGTALVRPSPTTTPRV